MADRPHFKAVNAPEELVDELRAGRPRPLVEWLIDGIEDEHTKALLIHDFIATHFSYNVAGENDLEGMALICCGYASLMGQLCELAGVECEIVSGYARGRGFHIFGEESFSVNHDYIALKIEGRWRLVDPTWSAGYIGDDGVFHPRYSSDYFCLSPEGFIHTHYPSDPRWQLLEVPLSWEQFERLPFLKGRFFKNGLQLMTRLEKINRVDSCAFKLKLRVKAGTEVMLKLIEEGGTVVFKEVPKLEDSVLDFDLRFPRRGKRYILEIYTRTDGEAKFWEAGEVGFVT